MADANTTTQYTVYKTTHYKKKHNHTNGMII